jgi:Asp-tRNA(Asn)/Glu-tRNA(Gln) amidotransferase A subunit family amidase
VTRLTNLTDLSAAEAVPLIVSGEILSAELVEACLDRIGETDGNLSAWAYVDRERALERAEELDHIRRAGLATGLLHGVPVGLKDIIDTAAMPTECGSPILAGRLPKADAAIVERLEEQGAIILGKTVTTEFAFLHPADTRNPHDPKRTPGGSSSGSAAAVAAKQVPLAIGTQTNGSVVRPASFCGTFGFKPSAGSISRRGILRTSATLDQIGVFGRSLDDVALLADALAGYDATDPASFARPRPPMLAGARAEVPVEPNFAWIELPFASEMSDDCRQGLEEVLTALGGQIERLDAPPLFADLVAAQHTIHFYEIARELESVIGDRRDEVSEELAPVLERGRAVSDEGHRQALSIREIAQKFFLAFFKDFDAIVCPAAPGEAPKIDTGTGNPIFSTIWTLAGLPCITIPLLEGDSGLPIGVQLVGEMERDDRLLRTANWIIKELQAPSA